VKVHADREVCIQAGNCVMVADSLFDQDDDGIVVVLVDDIPTDQTDNAAEAVRLCPSQALTIAED
jgi:ferredoxin